MAARLTASHKIRTVKLRIVVSLTEEAAILSPRVKFGAYWGGIAYAD